MFTLLKRLFAYALVIDHYTLIHSHLRFRCTACQSAQTSNHYTIVHVLQVAYSPQGEPFGHGQTGSVYSMSTCATNGKGKANVDMLIDFLLAKRVIAVVVVTLDSLV